MAYVYLCECGGGPRRSGTRPKDKKKRREEKTKEKKCQRLCKRYSIQL